MPEAIPYDNLYIGGSASKENINHDINVYAKVIDTIPKVR
ncbi:hypothetical protein LA52FAK_05150 [Desulforhopalus sp. 52FAK]